MKSWGTCNKLCLARCAMIPTTVLVKADRLLDVEELVVLYVCVYIYIYIHTYIVLLVVCVYIYIYIYVCMYVYIYIYI